MKIIEGKKLKNLKYFPEIKEGEVLEYCCLGFPDIWYEVPKGILIKYFEPLKMRIRKFNYIFTKKYQYSKTCKDGKNRNFILYFLDDILILKQKNPFNKNFEQGFDRRTRIVDEYILNGKMFQTRCIHDACGSKPKKLRNVCFPLSKKRLIGLNIPSSLKIEIK